MLLDDNDDPDHELVFVHVGGRAWFFLEGILFTKLKLSSAAHLEKNTLLGLFVG